MSARTEHKIKVKLSHEGWAHGQVRQLDVRAGDTVEVIAGKDKGKRGVVTRTVPEQQRIVVGGIAIAKRHTKAGVKGLAQGGIIDFNAPIAYSNVMLVCNRCDKPTRVAHGTDAEGHSTIVCKKCGERYERTKA